MMIRAMELVNKPSTLPSKILKGLSPTLAATLAQEIFFFHYSIYLLTIYSILILMETHKFFKTKFNVSLCVYMFFNE